MDKELFPSAPEFRYPTASGHVAAVLRRLIVSGGVGDGEALPRQDDLLAQFGVSHPTLREALRVLEAEGLVTVRRGKPGGAIVHRPTVAGIAYTIGLVLEQQHTQLSDAAEALTRLEPECGAMCAQANDRTRRVVPVLRRVNARASDDLDDPVAFVGSAREFHDAIIDLAGNHALASVTKALRALWIGQLTRIRAVSGHGNVDRQQRELVLAAHEEVVECIRVGDASKVRDILSAHVIDSNHQWMSVAAGSAIDVTSLGLEAIRDAGTSALYQGT